MTTKGKEDKVKCSADLDGKCWAAIARLHEPTAELIPIDYGQPFPWETQPTVTTKEGTGLFDVGHRVNITAEGAFQGSGTVVRMPLDSNPHSVWVTLDIDRHRRAQGDRIALAFFPGEVERIPRCFKLERKDDITGVSGTGCVAEGVEFCDGIVVVRWRGDSPTTTVHESMASVEKIHGHGGATRIVFDHEG